MMEADDLQEYLRNHLRLETFTSSEYTGGMNDGPMYTNCVTINLVLDGEVISSVSL